MNVRTGARAKQVEEREGEGSLGRKRCSLTNNHSAPRRDLK